MAITFKTINPSTGQYSTLNNGFELYVDNMQVKIEGLDSAAPLAVSLAVNATGGATFFTRKFYPGLSQVLLLDLREDIRQILALSAINSTSQMEQQSFMNLKLTVGSTNRTFIVKLGNASGTMTSPLTDIDYLDIDADTQLRLAIQNPQYSQEDDDEDDTSALSVVTQRGVQSVGNYQFQGYYYQDLLYGKKAASSLPVRYDEPFRIIYGAINSYTPVPSPIYCLRRGNAEKFMFLNKYGAWDVIPMFGTLKRTPEYTLESVATASGRVQTRAEKEEAYTQNSGNLTEKAFIALGDDLLSSQIYHWSGGSWHQITIEETDFSFSKDDELHSCTFRFRYCETDYTPSV